MLPQHLVYKNELNREYVITLARNDETPWWWSGNIETRRSGLSFLKCLKWKLNRCICWLIFEVILRNARCKVWDSKCSRIFLFFLKMNWKEFVLKPYGVYQRIYGLDNLCYILMGAEIFMVSNGVKQPLTKWTIKWGGGKLPPLEAAGQRSLSFASMCFQGEDPSPLNHTNSRFDA